MSSPTTGSQPARKGGLVTASALMVGATAALNLSMVLYHRQMSVTLGNAYGDLAALTGLINIVVVVASGASTWLTRVFAHDAALHGEAAALLRLRSLVPGLLTALAALAVLLGLAAWPAIAYLRLASWQSYAFAAGTVAAGLVMMATRALMQGVHRFGMLTGSYILEALGRASVPALLAAAFGVSGALAGTTAVALLGALAVLPLLWRHREAVALDATDGGDTRGLARDTAVMALFSVMGFLDILLFKHAHGGFEDALVGVYSRAAMVGKSFLYAGSAFTLVALPAFSAAAARGQDARPLLRRFLLLMAGVELGGLLGFWILTRPLLKLLVGDLPELDAIAPVARGMAMAIVPLALFQLVMLYCLALHRRGLVPLMAVGVAAYGLILHFGPGRPMDYVVSLGVVSAVLLVGGLYVALRDTPNRGAV